MSAFEHWGNHEPSDEDGALIVAAVNALPGLLDWIEAASKQLEMTRCCVEFHRDVLASRDFSVHVHNEALETTDALLSPSGSPEPPKP